MGKRFIYVVLLCKIAPYRNSLTYLLTYFLFCSILYHLKRWYFLSSCYLLWTSTVPFCSLAVPDLRVGHTMDILSPFISVTGSDLAAGRPEDRFKLDLTETMINSAPQLSRSLVGIYHWWEIELRQFAGRSSIGGRPGPGPHVPLCSVILIDCSMSWCSPSRPCVVFLACLHLALFLALSLSPGNSLVSSWCDHSTCCFLASKQGMTVSNSSLFTPTIAICWGWNNFMDIVWFQNHKWSPVSYRSSVGRQNNALQRLTFYRWATRTNHDKTILSWW